MRATTVTAAVTATLRAALTGTFTVTALATVSALAASTLVGSAFAATALETAERADEQPASIPPAIQRTITEAQIALAAGKAAAAAELFEQAAEHGEYTEAEVGEVRARLWAGQFRHAAAISNVVAGEHPESAEAQALLAYIEDRSGYTGQALQRLQREQQVHPHEAAPIAAAAEILIDRHRARDAIEQIDRWIEANSPQRDVCRIRARADVLSRVDASAPEGAPGKDPCRSIATESAAQAGNGEWPEAATIKPPAGLGRPVASGNGLIIDGGRRVVTLRSEVDFPSASIWVRNARGELRRARLEISDAQLSGQATGAPRGPPRAPGARAGASATPTGAPATLANVPATLANAPATSPSAPAVAILALTTPFTTDQSLPPESVAQQSTRGLCFTLSFPASMSTDAMLPGVTPCFAFDPHAADGAMRINIPLSKGERGSPVFDALGRWMGLADPAAGSPTKIITRSRASATSVTPEPQLQTREEGARPTIAMQELYERLAPAVVQVITYAKAE